MRDSLVLCEISLQDVEGIKQASMISLQIVLDDSIDANAWSLQSPRELFDETRVVQATLRLL